MATVKGRLQFPSIERVALTLPLVIASACGSTSIDSTGSGDTVSSGGSAQTGGGTSSGTGGQIAGNGGTSVAGATSGGSGGSAGVAGTSGGVGGEAGGSDSGTIGTVGETCSPAGALACNGNHQKTALVCNEMGTWAVSMVCGADQFCNTTPGPEAGVCEEVPPSCAGLEPRGRYCDGDALRECGPDLVTTELVENCAAGCRDGMCLEGDPCPTEMSALNCSDECGGRDAFCMVDGCTGIANIDYEDPVIVRTPSSTEGLQCSCSAPMYGFVIGTIQPGMRIMVAPPWGIADDSTACFPEQWVNCVVAAEGQYSYRIRTEDPDAPPRNVHLDQGEACP